MTQKQIKVKVFRYDFAVEKEAHQQIYEVPLTDGMSVLDVLDYIYDNIDSSLAYYSHAACRHGLCGKCVLVVNGKSSLVCQTLVSDDIVIETPSKFEVIRDLVYTTSK
jgi:succinate dehydrogenase/fumarate reductase-like Fe-S protein